MYIHIYVCGIDGIVSLKQFHQIKQTHPTLSLIALNLPPALPPANLASTKNDAYGHNAGKLCAVRRQEGAIN